MLVGTATYSEYVEKYSCSLCIIRMYKKKYTKQTSCTSPNIVLNYDVYINVETHSIHKYEMYICKYESE